MELEVLTVLGKAAGLGGISLGVFLILVQQVVKKKIFPKLGRDAAYRLLRLVLVLTWVVAMAGILSWTFVTYRSKSTGEAAAEVYIGQSVPTYNFLSVGMPWPDGALGTYFSLHFSGKGTDYELGWYQGNIRLSGYFVVHENVWMHQGMNISLAAVAAGDVLLNFGPERMSKHHAVIPRYTTDVVDIDSIERLQSFLHEKLGRLVFVNCEIRGDYADIGFFED